MNTEESTYLESVLRESGYRFNYDALARFWNSATHGRELKPNTVKWFEVMAPFLILAYQAGEMGQTLTQSVPFLEAIEK